MWHSSCSEESVLPLKIELFLGWVFKATFNRSSIKKKKNLFTVFFLNYIRAMFLVLYLLLLFHDKLQSRAFFVGDVSKHK